jgi:hypothetical protein
LHTKRVTGAFSAGGATEKDQVAPRDHSQLPVERLAGLLLERARLDPSLPRRSPANSNEPPPGWVAPAPARACRPRLPATLAAEPRFPGQERIADLVAHALAAAEEAEEAARATRLASRRAARGAAVAIVLGALGAVAGASAGVGSLIQADARPQLQAAIAPGVPPERATPAAEQASPPVAEPANAKAQPDEDDTAMAVAPPIAPATFVRVLPAVAAQSGDVPFARASGQDWGPPRRVAERRPSS